MKILHTADWHIGQLFHEYDRTYEHQQFLNRLLETLVSEHIDVLLISGDVFDLSNPSAASIKMFYTFLNRAVKANPDFQIVITADNHDIIGSADGKKFRLIAQEYTLDALLSHANLHLAMLSNRYLLQRIPNTLGLQVVDQYMGNEVRTVYSLSGGESFLASLALALGLASLSGSRMQLESLFIDEGFGSLDPATLNIAMDAVERLHHQGRKAGVISHVQKTTERIPEQIKVSKQQCGKSKVEVIGL